MWNLQKKRLGLFVAFFTVIFVTVPLATADSLFPYEIELISVNIPDMPGLHSFAFGQHSGLWLLVGGRLDGLHARQPNRSFPAAENNVSIFVVDPEAAVVWDASVLALPVSQAEQLQSTNMNFYQDGDVLYIIGGYGYSAAAGDHITHPFLTVIDIPGLIAAVQMSKPIDQFVTQFEDQIFAVTGGQLGKIGDELFLVGGHRFDGRYNPMDMPTFRQEYTHAIRVFSIQNHDMQIPLEFVREYTDPEHLRRRDYNLVPQYWPDGHDTYIISAGVFQKDVDLPFLYPVEVTANGYHPVEDFDQLLSHYHSAKLPLYDNATAEMHSIFFGGIAQFYYREDVLIQDDHVPFVETISRLTRSVDGSYSEYLLPLQMPGLVGASGEFIPNAKLLRGSSRVIHTEDLPKVPTIVGYIVGGIRSPELNPFSRNRTHLTAADSSVYAVVVSPGSVQHRPVDNKSTAEK